MPLNEGAVSEILPFAPDATEAAGELEPLASYTAHTLRLRGHQPGLARLEIQNRANRQAAHIAAGVAQFIANRHAPGVLDDGDLDKVEMGLLDAIFNSPTLLGTPSTPTPDDVDDSEQITNTSWVRSFLQSMNFIKVDDFFQSFSASGWVKFPNGLILQWMFLNTVSGYHTLTFPVSFPNGCFLVIGSRLGSINANSSIVVFGNKSLSSCEVACVNGSSYLTVPINVFAIGY